MIAIFIEIMTSIVASVIAGMFLYYFCKWLDRR